MKKHHFIFIGFIYLLVLLGIAGCATKGKAISEEDFFKTWSGTWTNTELSGTPWVPQKIITYPDGAHDIYVLATDSMNPWQHRITLIDKWTDREGNIWYTATFENSSENAYKGYEYGKISDSGNTLERLTHASDEPIRKWEPENDWYNYGIYYRE